MKLGAYPKYYSGWTIKQGLMTCVCVCECVQGPKFVIITTSPIG